jgi:lipoyl(octanoyl) transferase
MPDWFLLDSKTSSSIYNMALDEALLDYVEKVSIPVLRFYKWERPTLSLGYFQKVENTVDLEQLKRKNFDLIRRPTGGRAVLHDKEITYSITIPINNSLCNLSILESYDLLCKPIVSAINNLGLKAYISEEDDRTINSPSCFAAPTFKDIKIRSKKIVGSAQMRDKRGILQHGSILMNVSLEDIFDVLILRNSRESILSESRKKITSLYDEGFMGSEDDLKKEIVNSFKTLLNAEFITIDDSTIINVDKYIMKYSSDKWNFKI